VIRRVKTRVLGLVLVAGVALSIAASPAPELRIEAAPGLESAAAEVRRISHDDFSSSLYVTGLMGFGSPIRVVLASRDSVLANRTPDWVSGYADSSTQTIVLFPHRVHSYPDHNLRTLVRHEVTHIMVGRAARGRPIPRWFNEGVATVAAREWGIEDRARYAAAVVGRGMRTAAELDEGFSKGGRRATRSYALSGAFVRWMRAEYGEHVTGRILELVGRDFPFEEAFLRSAGESFARAEHRFFVRDAFWHTWVPFLTSSGALWAAITILALVAIRRRRARSAAMLERWEAEEELASLQGDGVRRTPVDARRNGTRTQADDEIVN
jgi:hypothetical protein